MLGCSFLSRAAISFGFCSSWLLAYYSPSAYMLYRKPKKENAGIMLIFKSGGHHSTKNKSISNFQKGCSSKFKIYVKKNRLQVGEGHSQVTIGSKPMHSLFHRWRCGDATQCLCSVALAVCLVVLPQKGCRWFRSYQLKRRRRWVTFHQEARGSRVCWASP